MAEWNTEGGFYEKQSGQGENPWSDAAEFDTLTAPADDTAPTVSAVSWSQLTAEAPYGFESSNS